MNQVRFAIKYAREHPNALDEEVENAYESFRLQQVQSSTVQKKAFNVPFRDPVGYQRALCQQIRKVADTCGHFNYLTIVQSSGYGKTRAGCELATVFPFVYVCFRESGSTGYPPATPKSMDMLRKIKEAENVYEAEAEALVWIQSIILTFHKKKEEFCKKQPQEKYQQALLKDKQQAIDFWNAVDANYRTNEVNEVPETKEKIILFIDEASALLSKKKDQVSEKNQAFRAIRRALLKCEAYVTGLLADTNPSVANLAPQHEHDISLREFNRKVHKPFIYLATMDCLSADISLNENGSGHDIVQFGRPLWGSWWQSAENWEEDSAKFSYIIQLAKFKLLGGTNQWDQNAEIKRKATLAVIACIATLHISPTSSEAPDLVKLHMATLIAIDDVHKKHLITYPSEPVLAEAALDVLSESDTEIRMLMELDAINKSSRILDGGGHGELVVRLLFLSAWRRLICLERESGNMVSFSVRRPVLNFLQELFEQKLPESLSYLNDFEVGFTHFIELARKPDKLTLSNVWNRRGAMHLKNNQKGPDFILVIKHTTEKECFGALVVQVESTSDENFYSGGLLVPSITFYESCADIVKDNYLGIYIQIGAIYKGTPKLRSFRYHSSTTRSTKAEYPSNDNRLIVHGLNSFKFKHQSILKSFLYAQDDPTQICNPEDKHFLYYMLPCTYVEERFLHVSDKPKESLKKRKISDNVSL